MCEEKKKVVIIDDELDFLLLVKGNLEATGRFEVVTSNLPEDAENLIRAESPDVILLDNIMPKRKGYEIVEALKKSDDFDNIPIIMISGRGEMVYMRKKQQFKWCPNNPALMDRGDIVDAKDPEVLSKAYCVSDYISKPFTTEILIEVIDDVLKKAEKKKPKKEDDVT